MVKKCPTGHTFHPYTQLADLTVLGLSRYVDQQGIARVCGSDDLKASQRYPVMVGRTASLCVEHS